MFALIIRLTVAHLIWRECIKYITFKPMESHTCQWLICSERVPAHLFLHWLLACSINTNTLISTKDISLGITRLYAAWCNANWIVRCGNCVEVRDLEMLVSLTLTFVYRPREKRFCHDPFMFLLICNKCFLTPSSNSIQPNPIAIHPTVLLIFLSLSLHLNWDDNDT